MRKRRPTMIPVIRKPDGTFACGPEEDREPDIGEVYAHKGMYGVPCWVAVNRDSMEFPGKVVTVEHVGWIYGPSGFMKCNLGAYVIRMEPEGVMAFEAWEARKRTETLKKLVGKVWDKMTDAWPRLPPGEPIVKEEQMEPPMLEADEEKLAELSRKLLAGEPLPALKAEWSDFSGNTFLDVFPDKESWDKFHEENKRETARCMEAQMGPPEMTQSYWRCPHCEEGVTVEHAEGIPDLDVPIPDGWTERYVADTKCCCGGGVMVRRIALCSDCAKLDDGEIEAGWREECLTEGWRFTRRTVRETLDWIKSGEPVMTSFTQREMLEKGMVLVGGLPPKVTSEEIERAVKRLSPEAREKLARTKVNPDYFGTVTIPAEEGERPDDSDLNEQIPVIDLKLTSCEIKAVGRKLPSRWPGFCPKCGRKLVQRELFNKHYMACPECDK